MSINLELLTKAAKVYDCSEPVEGMKPKMQYEEHKKMTPDEFSREHTNNKAASDVADLQVMLQQQAKQNTGSAYPMTNSARPPAALPPELAAALRKHLQLPDDQTPDEIDAAGAMWDMNDKSPQKAAALRYGARAAHAILPVMEQAFRANSRRSIRN
jgi:hypothetical protein